MDGKKEKEGASFNPGQGSSRGESTKKRRRGRRGGKGANKGSSSSPAGQRSHEPTGPSDGRAADALFKGELAEPSWAGQTVAVAKLVQQAGYSQFEFGDVLRGPAGTPMAGTFSVVATAEDPLEEEGADGEMRIMRAAADEVLVERAMWCKGALPFAASVETAPLDIMEVLLDRPGLALEGLGVARLEDPQGRGRGVVVAVEQYGDAVFDGSGAALTLLCAVLCPCLPRGCCFVPSHPTLTLISPHSHSHPTPLSLLLSLSLHSHSHSHSTSRYFFTNPGCVARSPATAPTS